MDNPIIKFDKSKEEFISLANSAKELTIQGVDDKGGFDLVHKKRMDIKEARISIEKTSKFVKDKLNKTKAEVIAITKEYIGILKPEEERLEVMEQEITTEIEIKKKAKKEAKERIIKERAEILTGLGYFIMPSELVKMSDVEYNTLFEFQTKEFNRKKEAEEKRLADQKAEQEKFAEEKRIFEEEQRKIEAKNYADKKAIEDEKEKIAQVRRDEENRIAKEKQDELNKIAEKEEQERLKKEAEVRKHQEEELAKEKVRLTTKYNEFLLKNGVTDNNKDEYDIRTEDVDGQKKITIFKKIDILYL